MRLKNVYPLIIQAGVGGARAVVLSSWADDWETYSGLQDDEMKSHQEKKKNDRILCLGPLLFLCYGSHPSPFGDPYGHLECKASPVALGLAFVRAAAAVALALAEPCGAGVVEGTDSDGHAASPFAQNPLGRAAWWSPSPKRAEPSFSHLYIFDIQIEVLSSALNEWMNEWTPTRFSFITEKWTWLGDHRGWSNKAFKAVQYGWGCLSPTSHSLEQLHGPELQRPGLPYLSLFG